MVESLCVVVVILSLTLVVGGFLGGPIVASERKKAKAAKDDAKAKADELVRAHKKAMADAATIAGLKKQNEEKTRDNDGFRNTNAKLADELADVRKANGHLDETARSLRDALEEQRKDAAELAEHAAHFASVAEAFRQKYGSKRTTG